MDSQKFHQFQKKYYKTRYQELTTSFTVWEPNKSLNTPVTLVPHYVCLALTESCFLITV